MAAVSEYATVMVELSLTPVEASQKAGELAAWLQSAGVIRPILDQDHLRLPSEFQAGPNVLSVAPGFDNVARRLLNNGVDIFVGRDWYHPYENYEPPDCPACGHTLDGDAHHELLEPWLFGPEPRVACSACGGGALLGDWIAHGDDEWGRWTFYIAELAVQFNNWPALTASFRDELGRRMGARWRVVNQHR